MYNMFPLIKEEILPKRLGLIKRLKFVLYKICIYFYIIYTSGVQSMDAMDAAQP